MKKVFNALSEIIQTISILASPFCFALSFIFVQMHDYENAITSAVSSLIFAVWDIQKEIRNKK